IFELKEMPNSIAVFGAGVIGLELGIALHNLGSKVTMFNFRNKILNLNDDINDYVVKDISSKIDFIYKDSVSRISRENGGYRLYYGKTSIWVEKILVATGRRPNFKNIGLESVLNEKTDEVLNIYNKATTQIGNY